MDRRTAEQRRSSARSGASISLSRRTFVLASGAALAAPVSSVASQAASTSGDRIAGETGSIRADQPERGTWRTVSLDDTYEDPVVIVKPPSSDGGQPAHVRLRDVSTDSFRFRIEEWNYLDGSHITERFHYVVVETGTGTLSNGATVEAGTLGGDEDWRSNSFDASFDGRPVVFAHTQTYRGPHEIVIRNRNVSERGFDVRVQEEEGRDGRHTTERIGYVAIEPTTAPGFEVGSTNDTVTEEWHDVAFSGSYDNPDFLADIQTTDGSDTAALRYRRLDSDGVDVRIEEERSRGDETNHTTERIGYLAMSGSPFGDGDGVTVLEDFESRSLGAYVGDVDGFGFETGSPIEGNTSLEGQSAGSVIATDRIGTPRGYQYRVRVEPTDESYQRIVFNAQDIENPETDCYEVFVGPKYGDLFIQERRNGEWTDRAGESFDATADTEYEIAFIATESSVEALVYDDDGSRLARTGAMDSTVHTGGHLGFGVGSVAGVTWDLVRRGPIPSSYDPPTGDSPSQDPSGDLHTTGSGVTDPSTDGPTIDSAIRVSEAGSFASALGAASPGDTVLVDGSYSVDRDLDLKSGVDIVGEAGTAGELDFGGQNGNLLYMHDVSDIWIHDLTIRASDSAARVFGSPDGGLGLENITFSRCEVNGGQNGISFRGHGKNNSITNVSILGCTFANQVRHGIFIGIDNISDNGFNYPTGETRDVLIRGNRVTDTQRWLALTLSGRPNCPAHHCLIKGNDVRRVSIEEKEHGNAISLEDCCHDNVIEDNDVRDTHRRAYGLTGQCFDNVVRNNYGQNVHYGLQVAGQFPHSGDPHSNELYDNMFETVRYFCIQNKETANPDNVFRNNEFTDWDNDIWNGSADTFADNVFN